RVDVAVQLVADALQQVEVEGGGDVGAVVVGRFQHGLVLHQVDPDQQTATGRQDLVQVVQQLAGLPGGEIADAGAGKEHQRVMDLEVVRQLQPVAEVGAGGMHVQPGIIRRQPLGAGSQEVLGNVDAQVADRPQSFEQQAHLATGSAAQFDQVRLRPGDLTDVIGGVGEN